MNENCGHKISKYEFIQEKDLNVYDQVKLFFYSYENDKISILLHKSDKSVNVLQEFSTGIYPSDELPTFAISRLMASTYKGLFTKSNIGKMQRKENLTLEDLHPTDEFKWYTIWDNPFFREWLDVISGNPIQYDRIKGLMVYFLELPLIDTELLNKNLKNLDFPHEFYYFPLDSENVNCENIHPQTCSLMSLFSFSDHIKNTIKMFQEDNVDYYIILACKLVEDLKDQAGFFHFPALIPGIYRKNNEKWIYILTSIDPLPDEKILKKCKSIIIPGSDLNVYEEIQFLRHTENFIREAFQNYPNIKYLGLCFGLQILVNALGGKIGPMDNNLFLVGAEKIVIDEKFWDFEFVKKSKLEKSEFYIIHQAHGDHVISLPDYQKYKIKNYASSDNCKIEILVSDDERIFCFQGHPEYETEFSFSRAASFLCPMHGMEITHENMIKIKDLMIKKEKYPELHNKELRTLCNAFLNH